jgi:hypothetical protein
MPFAPANVRTEPVVFGANAVPVTVTREPVEATTGSTVITPVGIFKLAVAVRVPVAKVDVTVGLSVLALSVAVMVTVAAVWFEGTVNVPVPEPSDPMGNVSVPVRANALLVDMVNVAVADTLASSLSTVIPVTVAVTEVPGPAVAGDKVSVRGVRLKPLDLPTRVPESVAVIVTDSLTWLAKASRVGILVA